MNTYALLVGVNYYLPNKLPNGLYYKSLGGCVQDITKVEQFLRNVVGVSDEHLIKLTSSHSDGEQPAEPPEQWPTYANIVAAFGKLASMIESGDQVYIHYSGHGGRCPTTPAFHEIKGAEGLDEVLVPMDLGDSEGRYLRDTELHYLLQRLVDKKCFLTLVLDSCHAGGATRARLFDHAEKETTVRGVSVIDDTPRPLESLVGSPQQLVDTWAASFDHNGSQRSVKPESGWWLEPRGYVLLAACRTSEYANEYPFEGNEKNGALTYWWLDSLKQLRPGSTYKMLHDRVLARVRAQFPDQTPQLQGEGNRIVFGREEVHSQSGVTVIENLGSDRIVLNAGQAHGVERGARFSVFGLDQKDFTQSETRMATVKVVDAGAASSTASILNLVEGAVIEPGCQAVLFDVGRRRLRRKVRLVGLIDYLETIDRIKEVVVTASNGFLEMVGEGEWADYLVTVRDGRFVICHANGLEIEDLTPAIPIAAADSVGLIKRLVHLARYDHVRALQNDGFTSFADKVLVELTGPSGDSRNGILSVEEGEVALLRVRNNSDLVLNFTVLDIQPDWGISQIYPSRAAAFESLDPGQEFKLPMRVRLPEGYSEGIDMIKVLATKETTSFRWLELPAMEVAAKRSGTALQDLYATMASEEAITRQVEVLAGPDLEWSAHQVEIEIKAAKVLAGTAEF
ncbi:MAG TPA: caspase family protein [Pyrinomonadaceae bacterium]|nr:caspase family protein [Pyrinomonadaceae bacterium]